VIGNSYAEAGPADGPAVLLAGHVDEIGLIVTHVDDEGYVYVGPIGGWDPQVLVGQRVRFLGRDGPVLGVVGKKPIHLMKPEEREKASKLTELWVDVGAASRAEALERLEVGDAGVLEQPLLELPNGRIVSRAIDNRVGAFVVLEAVRRYAERPGAARVVAVATTQEEIGYRGGGALVGATRLEPVMSVVVDVTFATDHPGVEKKELGEAKLGRRAGDHPRVDRLAGGRAAPARGRRAARRALHDAGRGAPELHRRRRDPQRRARRGHRAREHPQPLHALAQRDGRRGRPGPRGRHDRRGVPRGHGRHRLRDR
jgi:hypothetical protein